VLGTLFLLARNALAVPVFMMSLIGVVIKDFQNFALSNGLELVGSPASLAFTFVIFLVALGLYLYSTAMKKRAVLR